MPARERNHPLRLLTGALASSRPWTFLRSSQIGHRIRHSLSAKLAVAITLSALVLLLVFGIIVLRQGLTAARIFARSQLYEFIGRRNDALSPGKEHSTQGVEGSLRL